jgi:hypothetical protein
LNHSASTAYVNAEGQAIPLPFITGQQAQIQRSQALLAQPLESALQNYGDYRTALSSGKKAALDYGTDRVKTLQELMKPVSTPYGGTLSRYNPHDGPV